MAELQLGVPFLMDIGVIDVKTCEPLVGVLTDIWHANSTGHYAGHPEQEEALKWEGPKHEGPRKGLLSKYPRTKPDETFLRGAWPTNKNGVAQFSCGSSSLLQALRGYQADSLSNAQLFFPDTTLDVPLTFT